ncbi:LuxR C-terminal-related transcriptional regulator, partial [uncultured Wocania sp.]|uniref:transcriptional regulator n=1 Tax=uncultured Wocania sp. TaxID=2834404 RepID=UPI0030F56C71
VVIPLFQTQKMTAIEEVLKTINNIKTKGNLLSETEILSILEATKSITKHKELVSSIIFLYTTLSCNAKENTKTLTKRELQILQQIGNGNDTKNIALTLNLSISTIETHRKHIRKKLGLVGKDKLLAYAILNNITELNNTKNNLNNS